VLTGIRKKSQIVKPAGGRNAIALTPAVHEAAFGNVSPVRGQIRSERLS